jgi:hypothetical protein
VVFALLSPGIHREQDGNRAALPVSAPAPTSDQKQAAPGDDHLPVSLHRLRRRRSVRQLTGRRRLDAVE